MKYIPIFLILLIFPSIALSDDAQKLSELYLQAFSEQRYYESSNLMHCPENYTEDQIDKDMNAISEGMEIFSEEFGTLESWSTSDSNMYVTATSACGTVPYWEKHPVSKTLVYSTKHSNGMDGYIVFNFAEINKKTVLAFANHGLPMLGQQSISKIKQVYQRIANKLQASNN